ncbi:uncharacterized protein LOC136091409 [Hydra vulgaris]|uniref:Uncharacterized protein LOC136091409 n=1 Tax=Hydra vulgaris TaxID=6087 RepID=A0ABM4DKF8_HYDVU
MPKEMAKRKNKIGKKSKISERDKRIDRLEKTVGDLVQRLAMSSNISTTVDKISNSSNTIVIPPLASTVISPVSTTKLTYEDYKVFRSKYPGPYSNKSFVNWVAHGGKDRPLFRWPNLTPYSVPRARADKYENRGRSASRRKLEDRKDKSKYRDSTERRRSEGKESEEVYIESEGKKTDIEAEQKKIDIKEEGNRATMEGEGTEA